MSNVMAKAELGRFPMYFNVLLRFLEGEVVSIICNEDPLILHLYISGNDPILFTIYLIQNKQEIQSKMA